MAFPVLLAFGQTLFAILLSLVAVFLILLVLVQRGRGGGLAGALGGMGGSSAFGAKAGDVFTRITIVAAAVWILLCIAATRWGGEAGSRIDVGNVPGGSGGAATAGDLGDNEEISAEADDEDARAPAGDAAGAGSEDASSEEAASEADAPAGDRASDPAK